MVKGLLIVALLTLACTARAAPAISIGDMHEFVESSARTLLKRVSNSGTSTAFVRIEVKEIVYEAGKPIERDMPPMTLRQGSTQAGLIASPARLIIPVNSAQTPRLLTLGPRDVERYYRVRFVPVMPQQGEDFALTTEQRTAYADSLSAGLTLLTGFGAIVVVRPEAERYDTRIADEADAFRLLNAGNSTIALTAIRDCNASGQQCSAESVRRVLPGSSATIEKTPGRVYSATLVEGTDTKTVTF